jgi:hypothetical protein
MRRGKGCQGKAVYIALLSWKEVAAAVCAAVLHVLCGGCIDGDIKDTFTALPSGFVYAYTCPEKHKHIPGTAGQGCYIYNFYKKLRINNGKFIGIDICQRPDIALIKKVGLKWLLQLRME